MALIGCLCFALTVGYCVYAVVLKSRTDERCTGGQSQWYEYETYLRREVALPISFVRGEVLRHVLLVWYDCTRSLFYDVNNGMSL